VRGWSVSKAISPQLAPGAENQTSGVLVSQTEITHTVKAGENLTTIARRYGVTVSQLRQANNLKRKTKINSGMTLTIPVKSRPSGSVKINSKNLKEITRLKLQKNQHQVHHSQIKIHVVKRGENLIHIANRYQISLDALKEKNRLQGDSRLLVGAKLLIPAAEARAF
jgi:LysM repeat protein